MSYNGRTLRRSLAAVALLGVGAVSNSALAAPDTTAPATAEVYELEWGNWAGGTGVVGLIGDIIDRNPDIQDANGIALELKPYDSLDSLYTDLARQRIDVMSAGSSAAAAMAVQGAPVRIVGGLAPTSVAVVSNGKSWSADELEGSRIAAMSSTATWRLLEAWIADEFGLRAGEDYELVTASNNAGAVAQVAAGTADFAMAWEPHATLGSTTFEDVTIVATAADLVPGDGVSWQFSIVVTDNVSPEAAAALMGAVSDAVDWMMANADEADAMAVEFGLEPGLAEQALTEGLVTFDARPIDEEMAGELRADFELLVEFGGLEAMPPDSFYSLNP